MGRLKIPGPVKPSSRHENESPVWFPLVAVFLWCENLQHTNRTLRSELNQLKCRKESVWPLSRTQMILGIRYYLAFLLLLLTGTAPTRLITVRETPKMMSYSS